MPLHCTRAMVVLAAAIAVGRPSATSWAQEAPAGAVQQEAARKEIMESDRWRQIHNDLDEWLTIQRIYTPEQVSNLRAEFADRVANMSGPELKAFLDELEDRLEVLMSPEAEEARNWLGEIMRVARNPEAHIGGPLPDVAHMTASQIRDELERFQQQRASRKQTQSAFDRGRQQQVQSARDAQSARREQLAQPRTAATHPDPPYRSPYAPQREPRQRNIGRPVYRIGPWGQPIYWDPLYDWHPSRRGW